MQKKFNLYNEQGYLNFKGIVEQGYPFNFIWGGRGTGKTFGALEYCIKNKQVFMYSRTKQTQLDIIKNTELTPVKAINDFHHTNIQPFPISKIAGFYECVVNEDGKNIPDGLPLGYASAISTISNLRGFSAEDVKIWIYDEFIPQKGDKVQRGVAESFLHGYETMNRNRELQGKPPIQVFCLSNSDNVGCELFAQLGLIRKVSEMSRKKQESYYIKDRGIALFNLCNSPISKLKAETSLYKMTGKDSGFAQLSLENEFFDMDFSDVKSQKLTEYIPLLFFGEIAVYTHKSQERLYVCKHRQGTPEESYNAVTDKAILALKRKYSWIWNIYYLNDLIYFSDLESKYLLDTYFHM